MAFVSRNRNSLPAGTPVPEERSTWKTNSLPALLRQRDLALLAILAIIVVPEARGMQFARGAVFFYWFVAFLTFQLPSMAVFSWLARQAPAHVPLYLWILRLLNEHWRSMILSLSWWSGVLIVLPAIGICLDVLRSLSPDWFSSGLAQCVTFVVLLALATLLVCLPVRLFRIILWIGGLCFLALFALPAVATLVSLLHSHGPAGVLPYPHGRGPAGAPPRFALTVFPEHFSWSLFGLALLNQIGLNAPLFLDGEMRGTQRFLRRSTSYLWWAGCGALLLLLLGTAFWFVASVPMRIMQQRMFLLLGPTLGQGSVIIAGWLLFLGSFGGALAYMFLFSRAFLLAARQHYLPYSLARLNRAGTPVAAILTQSVMILCTAVLLLVVAPAVLRTLPLSTLLTELDTGDQFGLMAAVAGSLWCLLTALLFLFALWLFWRKRSSSRGNWGQRLVLPGMCLSGCAAALVCAFAPFLPDWPALFFSRMHWFPLILVGFACSLTLAWVIGELPRQRALLRAKAQSLAREKALREELQRSYTRERELHLRLRVSYAEVNRLYREQEQLAMKDQVTGLFNHRTFLERLEEEIARCHKEACSFLLVFLDLDHFKAINDTWGHRAGDAVLQEVAQRLQNALQPGDVAGRYGGEEFTVILANTTLAEASAEGERLRQLLRSTPCLWQCSDGKTIRISITVSIGIAAYDIHGIQSEDLLERADQAMYQAKLAGRDGVHVADQQFPFGPPSFLMTHPPQ